MHVRAWQAGYRGLLPDAYLNSLRAEERAARYDFSGIDPARPATLVAVDAGAIRGFATTAAAREDAGCGELCALYVDPDCWSRGIGAALVRAARARLWQRGFRRAQLWLLAGNARGERFYRGDGWLPDGGLRRDTIWGIEVDEVRFARTLDATS